MKTGQVEAKGVSKRVKPDFRSTFTECIVRIGWSYLIDYAL